MDSYKLAESIGKALISKQCLLATAESCTGGWVAQTMTMISGSSQWFERGFVTYSNEAKQEMLGVSKLDIEQFGAVSEEVAMAMAEGALKNSHAHYAISTTGIAGPTGGSKSKPVGTVCFGFAGNDIKTSSITKLFRGDRQEVRSKSVQFALEEFLTKITHY